ncbi:SIS domain-containing protein [Sphingomonas oligophenolica]|uniref:SIS domain-containing protein n=1 Tax=Sphingomonas oligophenolica TaxID=301154 RepID=A0ABU9Y1J8_9SPHN
MSEILSAPAPQVGNAESWTRREILQQPETLRATQALLRARQAAIEAFLSPLLARNDLRIVLTGAGSSAFIGDSLAPWLSMVMGRSIEAIATTDIVSAPALHLRAGAPTLLVSFGRSGNSPESAAAVDLTEALVDSPHHLIITCNAEGDLARRAGANTHVVVLPDATHDRAFAMTSSFTAMMFAALSIFSGIATMEARAEVIAKALADTLMDADQRMAALVEHGFERVVYLGSGALKGLAREASLKLLELTAGALVTAFDTPLGFRHGPKSIVTDRTLIVVFVSNDPLTRRYDCDMIEELRAEARCGAVLAVSAQPMEGDALHIPHLEDAADADLLIPFILPAQLFGLHASLKLGLMPDTPSPSGTVNRVVQGVRIHAIGA